MLSTQSISLLYKSANINTDQRPKFHLDNSSTDAMLFIFRCQILSKRQNKFYDIFREHKQNIVMHFAAFVNIFDFYPPELL